MGTKVEACILDNEVVEFDTSDIEFLFMLCCAKITSDNWNEPGYTFILIGDEEANFNRLDNFELSNFLSEDSTSIESYPQYLELLGRHSEMIDVEFLSIDEDDENEFVYEGVITADEEILNELRKSSTRRALLESLSLFNSSDNFNLELASFIKATLL